MAANTYTNPGYAFAGWNDGSATYAAGSTYTLSSDGAAIVFTAQWSAINDAYSYAPGTGSGSGPAAGSGLDTTTITLAANTYTNPGYAFAGWNDGSATYAAGSTYTLSSDGAAIVFTAQWSAINDAYSYAPGTGSGSGPAAGSGLDTTTITLAANTYTNPGYAFAGWNDGSATYAAGSTYTLSSDGAAIVFTAQWSAINDAYSYAPGTGSGSGPAAGSGLDTTTITLAANTYTNPGYAFAGWNDGSATYAAGSTYTLSSDGAAIVFTAQWSAINDAYSYAPGTGSGSGPAAGSGLDTTTITLAANTYTNPGYAFAGWNDGSATYAAGSTYTLSSDGAAIVFTAQWSAINDAYSYAPGTGSGSGPAAGSGLDTTTITLAANTYTNPGYAFAGWNDGSATYAAGSTYTLSSDGQRHRLYRPVERHQRRLLLRPGHRLGQRPGRGQRPRHHDHHLGRQHLHQPGLRLRRVERRLGHLRRRLDLHPLERGQRHRLYRPVERHQRRLLLRPGHRLGQRPGRGQRPRHHDHHLGRQHLHQPGLRLRRVERRLGHLRRRLDLHPLERGQRHRLYRPVERHQRRLLLRPGHRLGQRPGRGQRPRHHDHHLGRQHLHQPGLRLRRVERRLGHLRRRLDLHPLERRGNAIVFTAQWSAINDAYSYAPGTGSGSGPAAGSGLDTTTITLAANTYTNPGYAFAGWNDGSATYAAGSTYTLSSAGNAIVFTAQWSAINDAYSYAPGTGSGSGPAAGSGLDTTTITLAANTYTNPGYAFAGWNDGSATYAAGSTYTLSSDGAAIVFTAQWSAINDAYSYAPGTGSGSGPAAGSGLDTTTITLAANTYTNPGYAFAGWNDGSATYAAGSTYTLSSDGAAIVFTAQWSAINDAYSYAPGTGSGSGPAAGSGLDTTTITLAANTYTNPGYAFAGWNDGSATYAAGSTYTLSSDGAAIVFTAQWSAINDAYSYAPGTGSGSGPAVGSGLDTTTITLAANTYTNPGYAFAGWNDGSATYAAGSTYTLSSDGAAIVFTAQWSAINDAYSYAPGTGSGSGPAAGSGLDTTTITLAANTYTNPGYAFAGWNDGSATYAAGSTYTLSSDGAAIVFTAQWSAINDAYSYAPGTGSGSGPAAGSGLDTTTITLAANTYTNPGYAFAGWNDGSATYAAGSSYTLSSDGAAIVFTAQWSANATDTITFNSEGGSSVNSRSGLQGTTITLPPAPTYAGYIFDGWFSASSGGSALTSPYTLAGSVTLYAQWTAAPTTTVLVPATGADLSGTSTLDASASAGFGVSKVQFVLTGGSYNKSVIGTATSTAYGYYLGWITTTVPGGTYTLQSLVTDNMGNTAYSAGTSITVDNTPPTTHVATPTTGAAVSGTSYVLDASASASYGVAITKVQFVLTGGSYNKSVIGTATINNAGAIYLWNTTTVPGGTYTLQSLATDAAGNTAYSAGVTITVDNTPPSTAVLVPATGADLSGTSATLDASASASYGVAINSVQFVLTGGSYNKLVIGTATSTAYGYYLGWNTTTVLGGTYTLQSLATDAAGNTTYSAGVTITVDNTPPSTAVLVPSTGATISGTSATLDASASASYGVGIAKVQFALTGGSFNKFVIGTATSTAYGYVLSFNTTGIVNGTYTLQSLATDNAGNTAYSPGISVRISN